LALSFVDLLTSDTTARLKGEVRDDKALRDMFIFVNDRKVFYRSLADEKVHVDGQYKVSLDIPVPLEEGTNNVAVVVRESDDVMSRKLVGIYRRAAADKNAERAELAR